MFRCSEQILGRISLSRGEVSKDDHWLNDSVVSRIARGPGFESRPRFFPPLWHLKNRGPTGTRTQGLSLSVRQLSRWANGRPLTLFPLLNEIRPRICSEQRRNDETCIFYARCPSREPTLSHEMSQGREKSWPDRDSNPGPLAYRASTLHTELPSHMVVLWHLHIRNVILVVPHLFCGVYFNVRVISLVQVFIQLHGMLSLKCLDATACFPAHLYKGKQLLWLHVCLPC